MALVEQLAPLVLRHGRVGEQQLDRGRGRHERVVDTVVQRDRQLAHRRQPLRPHPVPVGRLERLLQLAVPPDPLENVRQEIRQRGVLGEVVVGAATEGFGGEALVAVGGHQDHRGGMRPGADRVEQVQAVGVGKVVVEQDDVRLRHGVERFPPRRHVHALAEPVGPDHLQGEPGDRGIVVDHQDAAAVGGGQSWASSRKTSAWRRETTASSAS